ncbi:hypothetical protein CDV55_105017 [Aspergillus turcosus]|uniref:Transketolase-like pyrimidine-binding domain-containing protein n=1 Tax=Aspergillus turcosus TaxID=1245748 RepID=A0A397GWX3_9EURO|nr:hypothetical protein CDV55_105017 [Aspergillus turcosus]RLL95712.1 hypothetical protein CFD26_101464 [Aspergillus turcosus]
MPDLRPLPTVQGRAPRVSKQCLANYAGKPENLTFVHTSGAMGMTAIGIALWKYCMRYAPANPDFFNRDRFVLSNGHTCLFQYTFLHLTGYKPMTMAQLKSYHSERTDSLCPGHPEIEIDGVEVTTGPLGQGVANAVGLAMAMKHLSACMIGDACLQEGVALESIQLAGHWRLNNLVIIYDNNQVTYDGSVDICNSEDINTKIRACSWDVIDVENSCYNVEGITAALMRARSSKEKPTFINIHTVIGVESKFTSDAKAHGASFGEDKVTNIKRKLGMNLDKHFAVPNKVYQFFSDAGTKLIPLKEDFPTSLTASRKSASLCYNPLASKLPNIMVGTADLTPSVNMAWKGKVNFQHGIQEHAMALISNGLAAFNKGTILPITSSFFMFYIISGTIKLRPVWFKLVADTEQQIHIATHDSIGTGEDGPTHQPIELAALYRAMPNILYIRPCDSEETAGAFVAALQATSTATIILLSRQSLEQYPESSSRQGVQQGAYVFIEDEQAQVMLIGVGAEMVFAVRTRQVLLDHFNIKSRIVSFPCQHLFAQQSQEYRREVLKYRSGIPCVVIEAYTVNGWERYADAGFTMSTFGHSLPGAAAYKYFGFDEHVIAPEVAKLVDEVQQDGIKSLRGEFRDLNPVHH